MTENIGIEQSFFEVEETETGSDDDALPSSKYEIFSYPADTTLKGYLDQWKNGQLYVPDFQREYVWDQTRASKLIESFLLGLPVPPTFLYKPAQSKKFWIIDGHQRIRSIVDFQKGLFNDVKFRLKGVDERWTGKTFEDLGEEERFALETTVLRSIVIQQTHPADHSSIFHIFERLNTGGIRLSAMEVRQCVYLSDLLTKIKEWNVLPTWREILGSKEVDKRLRDRELLLRVISLFHREKYEKPMKKFLNDCAVDFKLLQEKNPEEMEKTLTDIGARFLNACTMIVDRVGAKPFHLRGKLNFSALDAVIVTLMRNPDVENLTEKFKALVADKQFQDDVSFNTSDESVLNRRFDLAEKYLA
ncbi:DUF262 domain-containing protein [Sinorhizobium meliloti]|nr:DUF262 domain-containing protein [Sinorhizobium meliloti]